ncbi:HAD family hydrolase [Halalkalibacter sp. AB-rgal2]|uniref:HAD family hydrolase n=1 Tax=Halalkalibacter sp. AB-rgal2 TaxID=3242695 RepID=UPI00359EFFEC
MVKAVLFDLDGTLLNRDESVTRFIQHQYERLVKHVGHIPKDQYISRFIELDQRGYVWKDRVYQQLVEEYSINSLSAEELLQDYVSEFKHHCVPFANVRAMLDDLKRNNFILGMITNGYGSFQMANIRALEIEGYFEAIFVSEWEGMKKPEPRIFKKAIKRFGVQASECIFVGDHPLNDVKAAQQVGMKAIWKKDDQWEDVQADAVVHDLADVIDMVKSL